MPPQYPSVVISVDNIQESMKKVILAGVSTRGTNGNSGVGQYVSFVDTEGNG